VTPPSLNLSGILWSFLAALLWGFVPVYIGAVNSQDPIEIVAHRALWSGIMLAVFIGFMPRMTGGIHAVGRALATGRARWGFLASCIMLTANWALFVYAVQTRQVFDAAFGYFIYPLVAVLLGIVILGESLNRWGWLALVIVAAGVLVKAQAIAGVPWIALLLAITFGIYGVIRKALGTDPVLGMFIETFMLIPIAIGYILWMQISGMPIFFGGGVVNAAMALFAGVVTVVPLLLYHAGNRALPIIVASLVFYVNPTTQMLVGLLYFEVPFPLHDLWAFALIWTGTAVYFWTRHRQG